MIGRILIIALIAGAVAGLVVTGVQVLRVVPLIQQAETYEQAAPGDANQAHAQHGHSHDTAHDHEAWAPEDGLERMAYTLLANVLTGIGFALLLNAALAVYGRPVGLRQGVLWGLAGFGVFALAPAIGLPPELPGSHAADLFARQAWYFGTIFATGAGLAMAVFLAPLGLRVLGAVLIVVPHVIGAPHPAELGGPTPPELAAMFVVASLLATAVLWLVLGAVSGYLHQRFAEQA